MWKNTGPGEVPDKSSGGVLRAQDRRQRQILTPFFAAADKHRFDPLQRGGKTSCNMGSMPSVLRGQGGQAGSDKAALCHLLPVCLRLPGLQPDYRGGIQERSWATQHAILHTSPYSPRPKSRRARSPSRSSRTPCGLRTLWWRRTTTFPDARPLPSRSGMS